MLRLRELPVGSRLVGLYWPTSARFMRLLCPANAVIMSSPVLFPPSSLFYFHLLIFVLTSFVPRTKLIIPAAARYENSHPSKCPNLNSQNRRSDLIVVDFRFRRATLLFNEKHHAREDGRKNTRWKFVSRYSFEVIPRTCR